MTDIRSLIESDHDPDSISSNLVEQGLSDEEEAQQWERKLRDLGYNARHMEDEDGWYVDTDTDYRLELAFDGYQVRDKTTGELVGASGAPRMDAQGVLEFFQYEISPSGNG